MWSARTASGAPQRQARAAATTACAWSREGVTADDWVILRGLQRVRARPEGRRPSASRSRSRTPAPGAGAAPGKAPVTRARARTMATIQPLLHRPPDLRGRGVAGHHHHRRRSPTPALRRHAAPRDHAADHHRHGAAIPAPARRPSPTRSRAVIEQEINGVEGMIYMSSQSTADGNLSLTVTFDIGTDIDKAQVLVQNRVAPPSRACPTRCAATASPCASARPTCCSSIHLISPDKTYDQVYISNYACSTCRDKLCAHLRRRRRVAVRRRANTPCASGSTPSASPCAA